MEVGLVSLGEGVFFSRSFIRVGIGKCIHSKILIRLQNDYPSAR